MEGLIINGFPKCGNHPLKKACELLGQSTEVNHIPFADGLPAGTTKHIFIKRNPRNLPIAMLRWRGQQITEGMYLTRMRMFITEHLAVEMAAYSGWLTDPNTLVVSYEALIASDVEIRRIADYLGVPYIVGAFEDLPDYTRTWIDGNHSDYSTLWTPEIDTAWQTEGCADIQTTYGY